MSNMDHVDKYPELPISLIPTLGTVKTGEWRNMKPLMMEKASPCTEKCPAAVLIPHYFKHLAEGRVEEAYRVMSLRNPFPAVTGRICPHFCESGCNRQEHDSSLSIRTVERYLGDASKKIPHPRPQMETGKKIAVVGSGPAGMAAAYYLRVTGHQVVVFEKFEKAGGILRYGIPDYRLPEEVVDREIEKLQEMGIEFKFGVEFGKGLTLDKLKEEFSAVFMATGAWKERGMGVEGEELVQEGLPFLVRVAQGEHTLPGKRCAVIGGGNTAMDVARVLRRMGADVVVLYRRTEAEMPAIREEIEKAQEDGIEFHFLTLPKVVAKNGEGLEVIIEKMKLGEADDSGRRRPVATGETYAESFDALYTAIGELAELKDFPEGLKNQDGWLQVEKSTTTKDEKVFAGGDLVTGPATVVEAIAWGRKAAQAINERVGGEMPVPEWLKNMSPDLVEAKETNAAYFPKTPRKESHEKAPEERLKGGFREDSATVTEEEMKAEVERCFSCGHCNECGTCLIFCPDVSIQWGPGPIFVYDYCKGCGVCAEECPGHVISFVKEEK